MYQIIIHASEMEWIALEIPGVAMKILDKDQTTGAMTVTTRMEPGAIIPAHWHSKADETVFVLEGDFVEDGASYGKGAYFAGKACTLHGPHSTVHGCTVLTRFSAELDFQVGPIESD